MDKEIYKKIMAKKEFSKLPKKDVELAWNHFEKRQTSNEEKIKLTRDLLRKVFSAFSSSKLLNLKDKDANWALKKHISTRERLPYYEELYSKILNEDGIVFDLGAGVNGFSFNYIKNLNKNIDYIAVESVGQLVDLMNYYFKTREIEEAQALHMSLFDLDKLCKILKQVRERKIVFLFKVVDSLEMLERDYSKKLLNEIVPLVDKIVISFATESLLSRKKFGAKRTWLKNFLKENFKIVDEFKLGSENYLVVKNK